MNKVKILIVDDHKLVVFGFNNILSKSEHLEVVGEAESGEEALQKYELIAPDLILMDINMPGMSGIDVTKIIKDKNPAVKIIMLTTHREEQYIYKADMAGADGYLFKNCEPDELIDAVSKVAAGEKYYSKTIAPEVVERVIQKKYLHDFLFDNELTKREIEIIQAISEGLSNKQISEKLFISDRTVNTHRTNIMLKLNVKNSVELVVKAIQQKLI